MGAHPASIYCVIKDLQVIDIAFTQDTALAIATRWKNRGASVLKWSYRVYYDNTGPVGGKYFWEEMR